MIYTKENYKLFLNTLTNLKYKGDTDKYIKHTALCPECKNDTMLVCFYKENNFTFIKCVYGCSRETILERSPFKPTTVGELKW